MFALKRRLICLAGPKNAPVAATRRNSVAVEPAQLTMKERRAPPPALIQGTCGPRLHQLNADPAMHIETLSFATSSKAAAFPLPSQNFVSPVRDLEGK